MFHPRGPSIVELARQALSSTDRGYELLAEKFDYTPYRTPVWALELLEPILAKEAPISAALDLCCGTGAGLELLAPHVRGRLVGVDKVSAMLAVAKRNPRLHGKNVELVQADALAMPFVEDFDIVTCFGAFGHFTKATTDAFLQSVFNVLKPGGSFLFLSAQGSSPLRKDWWLAQGFNLAMRFRNAVISPPFIMFYGNFILPQVRYQLEQVGFAVEEIDPQLAAPRDLLRIVVAKKSKT